MIEVDYPVGELYDPERFEFGIRGEAMINLSSTIGSSSITPAAVGRFLMTMSFSVAEDDDQPKMEALFVKLSGQRKVLRVWHLKRPVPRGTLRGNPTTSTTMVRGATTGNIACTTGETLLRGDMVGLGGQAVMIVADTVAVGGVMPIVFEGEMRQTVNSGAAVIWDRPKIRMVAASPDTLIPYEPGYGGRFTVSYVEHF